ncbi:MAG: ribonuclease H family protein [bacterium]
MAKKNKYYVIWRGRKTGIFESWEECKLEIDGFEGAQYKGYPTLEEAQLARSYNYWKAIGKSPQSNQSPQSNKSTTSNQSTSSNESNQQPYNQPLSTNINPILPSISVDAACSGNPGLMEYRGVITDSKKELFRLGPYPDATNNIGEFLALVHGLALLKQHDSKIPIYSDSVTAMAWVRNKKCKTSLARTEANIPVFDLIARAERWLLNNDYTTQIIKWPTELWGEIPADFGRK